MAQKFKHGLAGSYGWKSVLSLIEVKFLDRILVLSTVLTGERFTSKSTPMVVGRIQVLVGCWTKTSVSHWLLARGLPKVPTN